MSNMVVRTNIFSLNAHRNMRNVGLEQGRASSRLSSGYRINSAADDAAGLAISETMRAQIRGLDQASRNAQDGQALIQTAEGGMNEITNMMQRIRELLVQASNDTNTTVNRQQLQMEITQLTAEISALAGRVQFNGMSLLQGDPPNTNTGLAGDDGELWFQIGPNSEQGFTVSLRAAAESIRNAHTELYSIDIEDESGREISDHIDEINTLMNAINLERAGLGAAQNRMDYTIRSLEISSENLSDAESRVRNADMAREMMRFTMANVLQQASVSMLTQANQLPNNLLQLLR